MDNIPFGIVILFKLLQFRNTYEAILFMLLGKVIALRLLHPSNAEPPIKITLSGIDMLFNPIQSLNAS